MMKLQINNIIFSAGIWPAGQNQRETGGSMDQLGKSSEMAENKLILLYLVDKLGIPLGSLHIIRLVLENKLMNYFLLQQSLNELCEGGFLVQENNEGKIFYKISPSGKKTLGYFTNHIPAGMRSRMDGICAGSKNKIRHETQITADFIPESEDKYIVKCRVNEDNFTLIDLTIAVGNRNDARSVCENWKNYSQHIYAELVESLTKKRD